MALKILEHGSPEYSLMVQLREDVLRKPLGLHFTREELDREKDDLLLAAFEEEKILACCLLTRITPTAIRLRQMAVQNALQGKGVGRQIMAFAESIARDHGYQTLTMHARKTAVGFYEKLGYRVCGNEFEEVSLPHLMMEKTLM